MSAGSRRTAVCPPVAAVLPYIFPVGMEITAIVARTAVVLIQVAPLVIDVALVRPQMLAVVA
jgi:hypothetical protein